MLWGLNIRHTVEHVGEGGPSKQHIAIVVAKDALQESVVAVDRGCTGSHSIKALLHQLQQQEAIIMCCAPPARCH